MPRKPSSPTATPTPEVEPVAAEPEAVLVTWLRDTGHAASEGGCHIGPRHYTGRVGQQVEIRADDAVILVANGCVKYLAQPEQVA